MRQHVDYVNDFHLYFYRIREVADSKGPRSKGRDPELRQRHQRSVRHQTQFGFRRIARALVPTAGVA